MAIRLFISHSSSDEDLASAFVNLVRAAFAISPNDIRCTSVDGCKLPTGVDGSRRLREEVNDARAFLVLLTPSSVASAYVLFELGARWGVEKPILPLVAKGATARHLVGPLHHITARFCTKPEIFQIVNDLGEAFGAPTNPVAAYTKLVDAFCDLAIPKPVPTPVIVEPTIETPAEKPAFPIRMSPRAMCETIRNAPPLHWGAKAQSYIGGVLNFRMKLSTAERDRSGANVSLTLKPIEPEGFDVSVRCIVSLLKYPMIESAENNAIFNVQGRVKDVDKWTINLADVHLEAPTEAPSK